MIKVKVTDTQEKVYVCIKKCSTQTSGGIQSVVGGTDISVDITDPLNPIVNYTGSGGGGSITPISKTTAELRALIASNTLVNGAWYINTDYQTIYAQPDYDVNGDIKSTLAIKTGSVEPLLLLATSTNTLSPNALSLLHTKDKLLYDINVDTTFNYGGATNSAATKGRIYERIDENNNRTDFDHRVVEFIRYDDGNGNYTVVYDNGNTAQEFLSFDVAQSFNNYFASVYPLSQFVNREFGNNVFYGSLFDNEFSSSTINNTFSGEVYQNTFSGQVNANTFSGYVNNNTFSGYVVQNTFSGDVVQNTFSGGVNNNTFSGEVYQNTFSGNVNYNTFSGDVVQNTFSGYVNANTFSGGVNNNTFSGEVYQNTFSGNVNYNTFSGSVNYNTFSGYVNNNTFSGRVNDNIFTHTNNLLYVTIDCAIASKTITETLYPTLFGTDFHKIIAIDLASGDLYVKAENSNSSSTQNKRLVNATTSGTFNLNHSLYSDWKLTLTGATTLTDSNLPTGDYTIEFTMKITGSFGLTLPSYWSVNGDTYDGTKWNFFAIQVHKGNVGSEEVTVFITNLA